MATYTLADNNVTVHLAVGNTATIKLAGNPTTGFQWARVGFEKSGENTQHGEGLKVERFYQGSTSGLMGAGGEYTFTVTPQEAGTHTLELVYCRSFEPVNSSWEKFNLHIES